jgi:quercetin dioxygenase-like cupin family protein
MEPKVIRPEDGHSVTLYGVEFGYRVQAGETGGNLSILEVTIPAGTLVKPHRHLKEDEFSIVLEGTLGIRIGDEESEIGPGTYLVKPRGVAHALWNPGRTPARVVEIVSPGGFERYFEEVAPVLGQSGPEWTQRFYELATRYGVEVIDDWVEPLEKAHGVKLNPG